MFHWIASERVSSDLNLPYMSAYCCLSEYLRHAKCYAKQKDKSLNCLADFNEDVNAISTDEYEEDDGSETVLCG